MTVRRNRILFISHHGTLSGAPISLLTLMKYFAANRDWDFRVLMRKAGPLRSEFEKLAPTGIYYQYHLDPADMHPPGAAAPSAYSGVEKLRRRFRQWRHERNLQRWVHEFDPDLVYSNTSVNGDILAALQLDKPTLIHVRELQTTVSLYNPVQLAAFADKRYRYFAVSNFVSEYLCETFGIERSRIDIVPGSIEPEKFDALAGEAQAGALRAELGLPADAFVVGGLGSVDRRKGVDLFVDAAIEALKAAPAEKKLYFVWIGAGGMLGEMKKRAEKAGVGDRIIFAGERKKPYPCLTLFNLGLMTSRDDPFPRSVMEMAAFGVPVICFRDSGGAAEFISDDCGVVLEGFSAKDMACAMAELANDPLRMKAYSNAARRKAREIYSTEVVGARAASLIDAMIAEADGGRRG